MIKLWEIPTGIQRYSWQLEDHIRQLFFSEDSQQVYAMTSSNRFFVYDVNTGQQRFQIQHRQEILCSDYLPQQ